MTNLEAKQELASRLDIDYSTIASNDVFSDTDLQSYINSACRKIWDYTFWDFTEHTKTATISSTDITNGFIAYPSDIMPSSIYYLQIAGKEFHKKTSNGLLRFLQANPTATDKFWAEKKRMIFFNPNAVSANTTIDIDGKQTFAPLSADADILPFSQDTDNDEMSGNDAIVTLAYSIALSSDKKKDENKAVVEEKRAYGMLDILKNQLEEGRASEEPQNTPRFRVPDYYRNNVGSPNSCIGRFSIDA